MPAKFPADAVAAELRRRLPGLPIKKLHKLLYYCQGHHLAAFGQPLFIDTVSAWDMGPVVGTLWYREKAGEVLASDREFEEADLNTIGYVVSRYGALTGAELEQLAHHEAPWLDADARRAAGGRETITPESMRAYFSGESVEDEDPATRLLASTAVLDMLAQVDETQTLAASVDTVEQIQSRLAALA